MEGWTEEEMRNKNLMDPAGYIVVSAEFTLPQGTEMKNSGLLWVISMEQSQKKQSVLAVCSLIHLRSFIGIANPVHKELCEIERLLLLSPMQGMAMQFDREFRLCHRHKSDEEDDSSLAF